MSITQDIINAVFFFARQALGRPVTADLAAYHLALYEKGVEKFGTPFVTAKPGRISRDDKIVFHFRAGTETEYADSSLYTAANAWLIKRANR